jgi:hypothetical protein
MAKVKRQCAALDRKHGVSKIKADYDAAHDACCDVYYEIAKAPVTGPLMLAVKLAQWVCMDHEECLRAPRLSDGVYELQNLAVASVYRQAVAECGHNPVAEFRKAYRNRERALNRAEAKGAAA